MFNIYAKTMYWINHSLDDPDDLCLHGDAVAQIGDETLEYNNATISAGALYLLRSLKEDHFIEEKNHFFPCCGFSMYAGDDGNTVDIVGCDNGVDWNVIHEGDIVKLITSTNKTTIVPIEEYKKVVLNFAEAIEEFYNKCTSKILPEDEIDREGYLAFWNEWKGLKKSG